MLSKMEPNMIVAPNLNGMVYRNFRPTQNVLNTFLDFVEINNEGQMLIGSTNLNGRFWDGSVCFFEDYSTELPLEKIKASIYLDIGVTDGKFLPNDKKIIVSQDSGDLHILDVLDNEDLRFVEKYVNKHHEDRITEISVWSSGKTFVTSCADASLRIWEITENNIRTIQQYDEAHYNIVSSVNASPAENHIFASCSYDRTALLWDTRLDNLSKVIYENEFCALTNIEWHPIKPHLLVVTSSSGDIFMIDIREPKQFVTKSSCFLRSIHKTRFNQNGLLAICADDSKVKIFDTTNDDLKLIYIDDRHNDFVRGLSWFNETLVSCGWDRQVYMHNL